ncbi:MAG: phosphatidate cytidylyltransferase [Muribaculaceae bacterium]|nr:phosphatidate cytidylyltransferase [Muribaculaceae bacterium]
MKNLIVRALSGIVYVGLIVGTLLWCAEAFTVLMLVLGILACREFQKMTQGDPVSWIQVANRSLDMLVVGFAILIPYLVVSYFGLPLAMLFGVIILLIYPVTRLTLGLYDDMRKALVGTAWSTLGTVYIGFGLAAVTFLGTGYMLDKWFMLSIFIMIWLNDTGAYCVGSLFGRRKLFERLSPKKSWEGFWGGFMFDVLAGLACALWFNTTDASIVWWIGLGAIVSVVSTWGDLYESLIKRTEGVKDAGNIIPGHGGILDRIDSLLFVAPVVLAYCCITLILF